MFFFSISGDHLDLLTKKTSLPVKASLFCLSPASHSLPHMPPPVTKQKNVLFHRSIRNRRRCRESSELTSAYTRTQCAEKNNQTPLRNLKTKHLVQSPKVVSFNEPCRGRYPRCRKHLALHAQSRLVAAGSVFNKNRRPSKTTLGF